MNFNDAVIGQLATMPHAVKPRLRFDKVALRFLATIKDGLGADVPEGKTVVFTVTAPLRRASKAATELDRVIRADVLRDSSNADFRHVIEENQIRLRIVRSGKRAPKVLGFVYTPRRGAASTLLDVAEMLLK
ncbi:MAG: hypothetical protein M3N19_11300 [Candidatus Eremiobacteraeota bacterium]|nr:hypothetical protein [Candidatus Eremiobacteraeota bacterium]